MIKNWLYWLNHMFDAIPEPTRLFTIIAIAFPGIVMTSCHDSIILMGCGMAYLIMIIFIRIQYLNGKL